VYEYCKTAFSPAVMPACKERKGKCRILHAIQNLSHESNKKDEKSKAKEKPMNN